MGAPTMSVQSSTQTGGKGFGPPTSEYQKQNQELLPQQVAESIPMPQGKGTAIAQPPEGNGGKITYPSTNGQPTMGTPNQYSNTVGLEDNQQQLPQPQVGKGKGV